MATAPSEATSEPERSARFRTEPWNPDPAEVLVEHVGEPDDSPIFQVRHDTCPFKAIWLDDGSLQGLFAIAEDYFKALAPPLTFSVPLPGQFPAMVDGGAAWGFVANWLSDPADARVSHWVERLADLDHPDQPNSGARVDRTAVLLASLEMWPILTLKGGQGLRVLAHVGPADADGWAPVRINGVTSTLPHKPVLDMFLHRFGASTPPALFANVGDSGDDIGWPSVGWTDIGIAIQSIPSRSLAAATPGIAVTFKTILGTVPSRESVAMDATSHAYTVIYGGEPPRTVVTSRQPLIAFATVPQPLALTPVPAAAWVFTQDPASRRGTAHVRDVRPRRLVSELDKDRTPTDLGLLLPGTVQGTVQLATTDFIVRNSRLADGPLSENDAKEVENPSHAHVASNEFSAVNAFSHAADFFGQMRRAGIRPRDYFRFVDLPLDIRYRAGILPGLGDGHGSNAQVRWTLTRDQNQSVRRNLEVRFALGDMSRATGRRPANLRGAVEHAPLGMASDPRWCWHEFGHVLIAASTGELELRFAHSVGDALGAILCDPGSLLACDEQGGAINDGGWRGVTFPWIHVPRRHDRDVRSGWAWCDPLGGEEGSAPRARSATNGYWTEQVLSSSLFRLYRAIGGDTTRLHHTRRKPNKPVRKAAADYCAYLIMRGISLLGPSAVTPCENARMFVDALCKADIFTSGRPGHGGYVGGTVHKVIQWAFERQGLYGVPTEHSALMGPESSSSGSTGVDLDIEDRRPRPEGPYSPVDFDSDLWHATADAIAVDPVASPSHRSREIRVTVRNRGAQAARAVTVEVRYTELQDDGSLPGYPDAAWQMVGNPLSSDVPGHDGTDPGQATFGPFAWEPPADGNFAILVASSCGSDRSNLDQVADYPCRYVPGSTAFLVAFDNNLGLTTVTIG